jgi:hypothetical protein
MTLRQMQTGFERHPAASTFVIRGSDWARERVEFAVMAVEVDAKGRRFFHQPRLALVPPRVAAPA